MRNVSVAVAELHLTEAEDIARALRRATGDKFTRAEVLRRAVALGLGRVLADEEATRAEQAGAPA